MNDLIFLDTETTGLDPDKHEIWEIAWAVNDGPIFVHSVRHNGVTADPKALAMNGYNDLAVWDVSIRRDIMIREVLEGNTLVCANPTFDRMFMLKRWGVEPYHYRSVDIESMAMIVFDWDRPRGLKDISEELISNGYNVGTPDHSAWVDVDVLRECYRALREQNKKYKIY